MADQGMDSSQPVDLSRHPSGIVPTLQNIVSTVNLDCKLDLKSIALQARNAEYNPKRFAAVIMRIREPKTTALIFASGKMEVMASSGPGHAVRGKGKGRQSGEIDYSDIGWRFCEPLEPGRKDKTRCNFCKKSIHGGGITRLKWHLAGGDGNVKACPKVDEDVKEMMKANLKGKKEKAVMMQQENEAFREAMFGSQQPEYEILEDSDDEDFVYPDDMVNPIEKRAYRRAIKEQAQIQHAERQFGAGARGAGGSGSGSASARRDYPSKRQKQVEVVGVGCKPHLHVPAHPKQKTIKGIFGNAREKVGRAISKLFFYHGIPANAASGPYLQHAMDTIVQGGTGVKAPTPNEIMNKYLPMEKEDLQGYIQEMKKFWVTYGVTIMADGWTSYTRKSIINFLVYCDGKTTFVKSVDASNHVKDSTYIYKQLESVINDVGAENVVQVVTDNGSNFKKAGKKLMGSRHRVFWTPCAAHCLDLILKDFGKLNLIASPVERARAVTTFIYNRQHVLSLMRRMCDGDIVRPGITRFATNYIALSSLVAKKVGLKAMFSSSEWYALADCRTVAGRDAEATVNDIRFWDACVKAMNIMEPVVLALRLVDGDKKPTMGFIYEAMRIMQRKVKEAASRSSKAFMKIINERWTGMLMHPLHQAAYYLNPKFHYKNNLATQMELVNAIQVVVEKMVHPTSKQVDVMNEIKYFRDALLSFGKPVAVCARETTNPAEWWMLYGMDAPNLRNVAVKILSQTASAGGCERNWSTFNLIHSKRRNRLGSQRLHDLVYVHYNLRLKEKHAREGLDKEDYLDPIDLAYLFRGTIDDYDDANDVLNQWMESNGRPVMDDASGNPDPQVARLMGANLQEHLAASGRHKTVERLEDEEDSLSKSLASSRNDKSKSDDDGSDNDSGGENPEHEVEQPEHSGPGSYGEQPTPFYREEARRDRDDGSPSREQQPPSDLEGSQHQHGFGYGYHSYGYGSGQEHGYNPYGYGCGQAYGYGGGQYMTDLTSSVSSMSITDQIFGGGPQTPTIHGGQNFTQSSDENTDLPPLPSPSEFYYGRPAGPSASDVPLPQFARHSEIRREESYEDRNCPRIGFLQGLGDFHYRQYIMDYKMMYAAYMPWERYVEIVEEKFQSDSDGYGQGVAFRRSGW